jgi:hypothetical protein
MTQQIIDDAKAALLSFADESVKGLPAEIDKFLSDIDNVNVFTKFAELQRAREWISVETELPKDGELIICFDDTGTFPATFYQGEFINIEGEHEAWVCTHWMRLPPQPPKKG